MPTTRPRNQHFSRVLRGSLDEAEALSLASDDVETTVDGSPVIHGGAGPRENEDDGVDGDEELEEDAEGGMPFARISHFPEDAFQNYLTV